MKHTRWVFLGIFMAFLSCKKDAGPEREITLEVNKTLLKANGTDGIIFTVKDRQGNNITGEAAILWNGNAITGNTFSTNEAGIFEFTAMLGNATSEKLEIIANTFDKHLVVEEYTATWCGYCPWMAYLLETWSKDNDSLIVIAVHNDADLGYPYVDQMMNEYGVNGYPTAMIDRNSRWDESEEDIMASYSARSWLDLSIITQVNGSTADIDVAITFDSDINETLKLVVILMENKLYFDQVSYYNDKSSSPFYNKGNPIVDFEHNHVLKKAATDIFGDVVPVSETQEDKIYSRSFTMDISGYDPANCEIVAFVLSENGAVKGILNGRKVKL